MAKIASVQRYKIIVAMLNRCLAVVKLRLRTVKFWLQFW